jgi:hypothetical protein
MRSSSPSAWQAFNWSPSTRHLVEDGNTSRRFRPFEPQSLRSPPRYENPADCVRSRQIRGYRRCNPDALIEAF